MGVAEMASSMPKKGCYTKVVFGPIH